MYSINFRLLLFGFLFIAGCNKAEVKAQCTTNSQVQVQPVKYWNFNQIEAWGKPQDGKSDFASSKMPTIKGSGGNNRYVALEETEDALTVKNEKGLNWGGNIFVYECVFRFAENYNPLLVSFPHAAVSIDYSGIQFNVSYIEGGKDKPLKAKMSVDFTGINRKSFSYYTDRQFHHFVAKVNYSTRVMEVWIDAQMIQRENTLLPANSRPDEIGEGDMLISLHQRASVHPTRRFIGDVDNFALYTQDVPETLIYKHYLSMKNQESEWDFIDNYKAACIPSAEPLTGSVSQYDFAPNNLSLEYGIETQMKTFPLPRFKPNHTLLRNSLSMDLEALAEPSAGRVTTQNEPLYTTKKATASLIQLYLARYWNYYLNLPSIPVVNKPEVYTRFCDTATVSGKLLLNAKSNPGLPVSTTVFQKGNFAKQYQKNALQPTCGTGGYYLCDGNAPLIEKGQRYAFSPLAPDAGFSEEGLFYKNALIKIKPFLNRPIDLFISNGEMIAGIASEPTDKDPEGNGGLLKKDPEVVKDYQKWFPSGFPKNWYTYETEKRFKRYYSLYRDAFLKSGDPELGSLISPQSKFIQYQIGGDWQNYRMYYPLARQVMTPFNGKYYATENFYPFYPKYWGEFSAGNINSTGRMRKSLATTLAAGDKFYSPFIDPYPYTSPAWEEGTKTNQVNESGYAPAQWLGLLKYLAVTGAEFFHNFYYRQCPDKGVGCREHGNRYLWMTTTPAYVQAITSRYESIFKNGNILEGENPFKTAKYPADYKYTFHAKDDRILVGVRKSGNVYVIVGNINPLSNIQGNTPEEGVAEINLEGETIIFGVRRQGSVYIYDKSVSPPAFYQLDGWHEGTHPYYWTKNFILEAELYDNAQPEFPIKTENLIVSAKQVDARNTLSFITLNSGGSEATYHFQPNVNGNKKYRMEVKARVLSGSGNLEIRLDGAKKGNISVSSQNWQTISLPQSFSEVALNQEHKIAIKAIGTTIQVEVIRLIAE